MRNPPSIPLCNLQDEATRPPLLNPQHPSSFLSRDVLRQPACELLDLRLTAPEHMPTQDGHGVINYEKQRRDSSQHRLYDKRHGRY